MDASTQTTWLSRDSANVNATKSRSDRKPPSKQCKHQWTENNDAEEDREESIEFGQHGGNRTKQKGFAACAQATKAAANEAVHAAIPSPAKRTSRSSSPPSLGETSSTVLVHQSGPQKDEELTKLDTAADVRGEGTPAGRVDINSDMSEGIQIVGHSLRRRPDRPSQQSQQSQQSQAEPEIFAVPMPQDAIDHTGAVMQRENYLLKMCRALMTTGAPTHRLEGYMHRTAEVLALNLQSFYMPGCMILSFNDSLWRSKDVHIVRCTEALNLSKLDDVHVIYKDIIHKRTTIEHAMARLDEIMNRGDKFPLWFQVLLFGLAAATIGPVSFSARPIDLPIIFILGAVVGFLQLTLAKKSELYAHVFEISITIMTAFIARAFGSIPLGPSTRFCFAAICQAPLIMIVPGFVITNSALELQSKNMVSGSVRMVYGIIFTLFLAFGITIGITIYGAIDSNATSDTQCATTWPFWWQIIFVPAFTLVYILINQGKWKKTPVMIVVALAGWVVNYFSAQAFSANAQIAQALGALTVGLLANTYSRLGLGLAVSIMYPALYLQVPGSLAAGGSLISGLQSADDLTRGSGSGSATTGQPASRSNNTAILNAGYAMVEIGIGITVGLSVSVLMVYPFRKKKGKSGLFSF